MGSGVGDPFGPRCNKGDIMGCGVLFPRDFELRSDSEEESEAQEVMYGYLKRKIVGSLEMHSNSIIHRFPHSLTPTDPLDH